MQFSFGQYKGREISDIANANPGYLEWVHKNCLNINDDEFMEIRRILKDTSEWDRIRSESIRAEMTYQELKKEYVGNYLFNHRMFWFIKGMKNDCEKTLYDISLYGVYVFNASTNDNSCLLYSEDGIGMGHIHHSDLLKYNFCTKEDFIRNLNKANEKILNHLK